VVTSPEPNHEPRGCEMAAKLRERKMGRELDCRETEREVLGFCFKGRD